MTLWLILTIMTSAAAVLVSAPFVRRFDQRRARAANEVEVYRDHLKEVEREATLGVIDADQAESARVEIKRRLLAADRADGPALPGLAAEERKFAMIAVSGMVILGSVGLYAVTGNPDLPSSSGTRRASSAIPRELSILESFVEATQASTSENQRQQPTPRPDLFIFRFPANDRRETQYAILALTNRPSWFRLRKPARQGTLTAGLFNA